MCVVLLSDCFVCSRVVAGYWSSVQRVDRLWKIAGGGNYSECMCMCMGTLRTFELNYIIYQYDCMNACLRLREGYFSRF